MHTGDEIPLVRKGQSLSDAIVEMSSKGLGMTGVINGDQQLQGIYTDGDLRRSLEEKHGMDTPIEKVMSVDPVTVRPDILAAELIAIMKTSSINGIFVTRDGKIKGALNMLDLLRAGVM